MGRISGQDIGLDILFIGNVLIGGCVTFPWSISENCPADTLTYDTHARAWKRSCNFWTLSHTRKDTTYINILLNTEKKNGESGILEEKYLWNMVINRLTNLCAI